MSRLLQALVICISVGCSIAARGHARNWFGSQWLQSHQLGHLSEVPTLERSLQASERNTSVAICASMKDENSTDVREWLMYYRWLGVDNIYLTENSKTPSPHMREQLQDFVDSGFLSHNVERLNMAQMKVYYDCMRQNYHKHDWLAFFDLDEYLVFLERPEQKLPQFMDGYKDFPGLSVHWVLVGPSERLVRPPGGGVLRHYKQCAGTGNQGLKTIANTRFLANIAPHPHNFEFRDGLQSVDEKKEPIPFLAQTVCSPIAPASSSALTSVGTDLGYMRDRLGRYCYWKPGPSKKTKSVEKVALFHYVTKSHADFSAKIKRGPGVGRKKTWPFFLIVTQATKQWGGICEVPGDLAEECCPEEDLVLHA